jgi:hypothetical protein
VAREPTNLRQIVFTFRKLNLIRFDDFHVVEEIVEIRGTRGRNSGACHQTEE